MLLVSVYRCDLNERSINTKLTYTTIKQTDPCENNDTTIHPYDKDCKNGKCIYTFENGKSCECNDGWRGEICDIQGTRRQNVKNSNYLLDLKDLCPKFF